MNRNIDFGGLYEEPCIQFILEKRAEGRQYPANSQYQLRMFARALEEANSDHIEAPEEVVENFIALRQGEKIATQRKRCDIARQFTLFLLHKGYQDVHVPTAVPLRTKEIDQKIVPYIFSREEILRVTETVDHLPVSAWSPGRGKAIAITFRLLYSCGLRISEALSLTVENVDLERGVLSVIKSKNYASRYVPMCDSTARSCENYMAWRNSLFPHAGEEPFIVSRDGSPYSRGYMGTLLSQAFASCGVLRADGTPPRPHDLRHTAAIHALNRAYESGLDEDAILPLLCTYLGHRWIADTEYYLKFTDAGRRRIIDKMASVYGCEGGTYSDDEQ